MIGAMVLHQGKNRRNENRRRKNARRHLSCYLTRSPVGVHVVTVNDYLAKRDAEWMGKIYEFLASRSASSSRPRRQRASRRLRLRHHLRTNNEFGFDYLRDNMKFEIKDCVQRGHYTPSLTKSIRS